MLLCKETVILREQTECVACPFLVLLLKFGGAVLCGGSLVAYPVIETYLKILT